MLSELVKTVKVQLYERVTSPLFSTFIISWCLWNYKFILLLADKSKYEQKILIIDGALYPTFYHSIGLNLVGPLCTAIFMIYIYPIPAKRVFEHWRTQQLELKKIQQRIEDETPMTVEESRTIRHEALKVEVEFHSQLKKKDEEIADLKKLIIELRENKHNNKPTSDQQSVELTNADIKSTMDFANKMKILQFHYQSPEEKANMEKIIYAVGTSHTPTFEGLTRRIDIDNLMLSHMLDRLIDEGFVELNFNDDYGDNIYSLTKSGRSLIVQTDLYKNSASNNIQ